MCADDCPLLIKKSKYTIIFSYKKHSVGALKISIYTSECTIPLFFDGRSITEDCLYKQKL